MKWQGKRETTIPFKMKKSLFAVMAVCGVLASTSAVRADRDGSSQAIKREAGISLGESGRALAMQSNASSTFWRGQNSGRLFSAASWRPAGASTAFKSSIAAGRNRSTQVVLFGEPLSAEGPWSMASSFGGLSPLMMSSFSRSAVPGGEFKALLSLIDGASIRSHTADVQRGWIMGAYWICATLLGLLAVIYLPWNTRPPAAQPGGMQATKDPEPLTP